jgi:hypothetical protein
MGRELLCKVRSAGRRGSGKALLEADEIIFRGNFRLKIPFASLQSVLAHVGELHLMWTDGSAAFELGEQANKWAHTILHPKSTAEKLGIKPGLIISAIAMRDVDFVKEMGKTAESFSQSTALQNSDLIFYGAENIAELSQVPRLATSLASAGALWIVYPKGRQDIREQQVLAAGKAAGLVDVKVVRFSATHTALKFVRPRSAR